MDVSLSCRRPWKCSKSLSTIHPNPTARSKFTMYTAAVLLLAAALATAEVHTVDVGEGGLVFEPQTLTVKTGDTVIFHLYPRHNVMTGPFSSPCTPTDGDGGFYSGEYDDTDDGEKKFVVNVTSEDAAYYYCSVQRHCQNGMVGGWNLP